MITSESPFALGEILVMSVFHVASNNAGCNWDKGDCCGPANNYKYCKECKVC